MKFLLKLGTLKIIYTWDVVGFKLYNSWKYSPAFWNPKEYKLLIRFTFLCVFVQIIFQHSVSYFLNFAWLCVSSSFSKNELLSSSFSSLLLSYICLHFKLCFHPIPWLQSFLFASAVYIFSSDFYFFFFFCQDFAGAQTTPASTSPYQPAVLQPSTEPSPQVGTRCRDSRSLLTSLGPVPVHVSSTVY